MKEADVKFLRHKAYALCRELYEWRQIEPAEVWQMELDIDDATDPEILETIIENLEQGCRIAMVRKLNE